MTNEELCLQYQAGDTDVAEELVSRNRGFIQIKTNLVHQFSAAFLFQQSA